MNLAKPIYIVDLLEIIKGEPGIDTARIIVALRKMHPDFFIPERSIFHNLKKLEKSGRVKVEEVKIKHGKTRKFYAL